MARCKAWCLAEPAFSTRSSRDGDGWWLELHVHLWFLKGWGRNLQDCTQCWAGFSFPFYGVLGSGEVWDRPSCFGMILGETCDHMIYFFPFLVGQNHSPGDRARLCGSIVSGWRCTRLQLKHWQTQEAQQPTKWSDHRLRGLIPVTLWVTHLEVIFMNPPLFFWFQCLVLVKEHTAFSTLGERFWGSGLAPRSGAFRVFRWQPGHCSGAHRRWNGLLSHSHPAPVALGPSAVDPFARHPVGCWRYRWDVGQKLEGNKTKDLVIVGVVLCHYVIPVPSELWWISLPFCRCSYSREGLQGIDRGFGWSLSSCHSATWCHEARLREAFASSGSPV